MKKLFKINGSGIVQNRKKWFWWENIKNSSTSLVVGLVFGSEPKQ
jgi:hypothetical protein